MRRAYRINQVVLRQIYKESLGLSRQEFTMRLHPTFGTHNILHKGTRMDEGFLEKYRGWFAAQGVDPLLLEKLADFIPEVKETDDGDRRS
jgi:hypothetical protein